MEEFTPINTQEELDAIIKGRLSREKEASDRKYADFEKEVKAKNAEYESKIKELTDQIANYDTQLKGIGTKDKEIEELKGKVRSYETASLKAQIAHDMGLPYGLSGRLSGEDEESIRKDAESLKSLIGESTPEAPGVRSEPSGDNSSNAQTNALRNTLKAMKGE